jgi:hypothetical protein
MTHSLTLGAAAFGFYVVAVCILLRFTTRHAPVAVVGLAALAFYVIGISLPLLLGEDVFLWAYSAVYCCATLSFLMLFGAAYKSISLRMLGYLFERPAQQETYRALMHKYIVEETFGKRLNVIQERGFAVRIPEGFVLTEKGRKIAAAARSLHAIFAIEKSG